MSRDYANSKLLLPDFVASVCHYIGFNRLLVRCAQQVARKFSYLEGPSGSPAPVFALCVADCVMDWLFEDDNLGGHQNALDCRARFIDAAGGLGVSLIVLPSLALFMFHNWFWCEQALAVKPKREWTRRERRLYRERKKEEEALERACQHVMRLTAEEAEIKQTG